MKITMTKLAAGPQGVARPGTVLEMSEADGKEMIQGLFARPYDNQRDSKAKKGWTKADDSK